MSSFVCPKCGARLSVPVHCGREMHIEGDQLVCWMGPACGHQNVPTHCGTSMKLKK